MIVKVIVTVEIIVLIEIIRYHLIQNMNLNEGSRIEKWKVCT